MIGAGTTSRSAQLAIIEIGNALCHSAEPTCGGCPLFGQCRWAHREETSIGGADAEHLQAIEP
jgi:adenine-specific DNA glycosylase